MPCTKLSDVTDEIFINGGDAPITINVRTTPLPEVAQSSDEHSTHSSEDQCAESCEEQCAESSQHIQTSPRKTRVFVQNDGGASVSINIGYNVPNPSSNAQVTTNQKQCRHVGCCMSQSVPSAQKIKDMDLYISDKALLAIREQVLKQVRRRMKSNISDVQEGHQDASLTEQGKKDLEAFLKLKDETLQSVGHTDEKAAELVKYLFAGIQAQYCSIRSVLEAAEIIAKGSAEGTDGAQGGPSGQPSGDSGGVAAAPAVVTSVPENTENTPEAKEPKQGGSPGDEFGAEI